MNVLLSYIYLSPYSISGYTHTVNLTKTQNLMFETIMSLWKCDSVVVEISVVFQSEWAARNVYNAIYVHMKIKL